VHAKQRTETKKIVEKDFQLIKRFQDDMALLRTSPNFSELPNFTAYEENKNNECIFA
jgi:hypothetical protein